MTRHYYDKVQFTAGMVGVGQESDEEFGSSRAGNSGTSVMRCLGLQRKEKLGSETRMAWWNQS